MKQIVQNLRTGEVLVADVPAPMVRDGHILIKTTCSVISPGTERMLAEFGVSGWRRRAREHPEKVKAALERIKTDGLRYTLRALARRLDRPLPLGYSQAGVVTGIGKGVTGFRVGDRVASNGPHAQWVCVPANAVALIPEGVRNEEAAFTAIGSVALQGIRLLAPDIGETVVVIGLGLTGMLAALLLKANGCRVMGSDPDEAKCEIARQLGITAVNPDRTDLPAAAAEFTGDRGADGVIIAAASKSDHLASQAARMSRKRGRIILTGVTGLRLNRSEFYEKELSFQVSCSYGPGRYDPGYETKGLDYPFGFVRWTMNRNFQAFLQLIASRSLDLAPLVTQVVPLGESATAYKEMKEGKGLGYVISYPDEAALESGGTVAVNRSAALPVQGSIGIIGAGNFVNITLLPSLKGVSVKAIASAGGVSASFLAGKYGMAYSTTDYTRLLADPEIGLVFIATRHNLHAEMVVNALKAGKHVFVEKPLAIYHEELDDICALLATDGIPGSLTVGFNRRFSPFVVKMKKLLQGMPVNVIATMNAGTVDLRSWVHDREEGGGRILGEACHLIDLVTFLAGSPVTAVCANYFGTSPVVTGDSAVIMLKFSDGSTGTIHYFANGNKAYAKERVEVYGQGKTLVLDNFRKLKGFGFPGFSGMNRRMDKGHTAQFRELLRFVKEGGEPLVPFSEILNVSRAALAVYDSFSEEKWVYVKM